MEQSRKKERICEGVMAKSGSRFPLHPLAAGSSEMFNPGEVSNPPFCENQWESSTLAEKDSNEIHVVIYKEEKDVERTVNSSGQTSSATTSVHGNQTWCSLDIAGGSKSKGPKSRASTVTRPRTKGTIRRGQGGTEAEAGREKHVSSKENWIESCHNILIAGAMERNPVLSGQATVSFTARGPLTVQQPVAQSQPSQSSLERSSSTHMEHVNQLSCDASTVTTSGASSPKSSGSHPRLFPSPMAASTPVSKTRVLDAKQAEIIVKKSRPVLKRLQAKIRSPKQHPMKFAQEQPSGGSASFAHMTQDSRLCLTASTSAVSSDQPLAASGSTIRRFPNLDSPQASSARAFPLSSATSQDSKNGRTVRSPQTPSVCENVGRPSFNTESCQMTQDSGIGASLMQTPLIGEGHPDMDLGATCSSWGGTSEDSNNLLSEMPLERSLDENSNSQDDGEMNSSLTGMKWLSQFSYPEKSAPSSSQSQAEKAVSSPQARVQSTRSISAARSRCNCKSTEGAPEKPDWRYKELIEMALSSTPDLTMTSKQIREYLMSTFPYFKFHENCLFWKNAIRHNLSSNDCFKKDRVRKQHWTLDVNLVKEGANQREMARNRSRSRSALSKTPSADRNMNRPVGQQLFLGSSNIPAPCSLFYNNSATPSGLSAILPRTSLPSQFTVFNVGQLPSGQMLLHIPSSDSTLLPASLSQATVVPKLPIPPLPSTSSSAGRKASSGIGKKRKLSQGAAGTHSKNMKKWKSAESKSTGKTNVLLQAAIESGLTTGCEGMEQDPSSVTSECAGASPSLAAFTMESNQEQLHQSQASDESNKRKRTVSLPAVVVKRPKISATVTSQAYHGLGEEEADLPAVGSQAASQEKPSSSHSMSGMTSLHDAHCSEVPASKLERDSDPLHSINAQSSDISAVSNPMLSQTVMDPSPTRHTSAQGGSMPVASTSTPMAMGKLKIAMEPPASPIPEVSSFVLGDMSEFLAHPTPQESTKKNCPSTPEKAPKDRDSHSVLMTPPSTSLKNMQYWPSSTMDTSMNLGLGQFLDLPDDLSMVDQSEEDDKNMVPPDRLSSQMKVAESSTSFWGSSTMQQACSDQSYQGSKEGQHAAKHMPQHTSADQRGQLRNGFPEVSSGSCSQQQKDIAQESYSVHQQAQNTTPQTSTGFSRQSSRGQDQHRPEGIDLLYREQPPSNPPVAARTHSGSRSILSQDPRGQQSSSVQPATSSWYCVPVSSSFQDTQPQTSAQRQVPSKPSPPPSRRSLLPQLVQEGKMAQQNAETKHNMGVQREQLGASLPVQQNSRDTLHHPRWISSSASHQDQQCVMGPSADQPGFPQETVVLEQAGPSTSQPTGPHQASYQAASHLVGSLAQAVEVMDPSHSIDQAQPSHQSLSAQVPQLPFQGQQWPVSSQPQWTQHKQAPPLSYQGQTAHFEPVSSQLMMPQQRPVMSRPLQGSASCPDPHPSQTQPHSLVPLSSVHQLPAQGQPTGPPYHFQQNHMTRPGQQDHPAYGTQENKTVYQSQDMYMSQGLPVYPSTSSQAVPSAYLAQQGASPQQAYMAPRGAPSSPQAYLTQHHTHPPPHRMLPAGSPGQGATQPSFQPPVVSAPGGLPPRHLHSQASPVPLQCRYPGSQPVVFPLSPGYAANRHAQPHVPFSYASSLQPASSAVASGYSVKREMQFVPISRQDGAEEVQFSSSPRVMVSQQFFPPSPKRSVSQHAHSSFPSSYTVDQAPAETYLVSSPQQRVNLSPSHSGSLAGYRSNRTVCSSMSQTAYSSSQSLYRMGQSNLIPSMPDTVQGPVMSSCGPRPLDNGALVSGAGSVRRVSFMGCEGGLSEYTMGANGSMLPSGHTTDMSVSSQAFSNLSSDLHSTTLQTSACVGPHIASGVQADGGGADKHLAVPPFLEMSSEQNSLCDRSSFPFTTPTSRAAAAAGFPPTSHAPLPGTSHCPQGSSLMNRQHYMTSTSLPSLQTAHPHCSTATASADMSGSQTSSFNILDELANFQNDQQVFGSHYSVDLLEGLLSNSSPTRPPLQS